MKYRIKDLVTVKRGSSPRPIIEFLAEEGYPWLKISDFKIGQKYVYDTKEFIIEEGLKKTRYVKKGTLILTNSATPGIPIFLGRNMCLHDGFLFFENISSELNINYLYYWLLNYRNKIINYANGSVFKNLKKEIVEELEIDLPSLEIQNKIVNFLNIIDKKIDLNNNIIKDSHKLLSTYFNDCLIDNTENTSKKLFEVADIKNGFAFKGTDFIEKGVPVIKIKNVKPNTIVMNDLAYVSENTVKDKEKFKVNFGDVLITMSGNRIDGSPDSWVGKVAIFDRIGDYYLNQRVGMIVPKNNKIVNNFFIAEALSTIKMQKYFIERGTSSGGQANISPEIIKNVELKIPKLEKMNNIENLGIICYNLIRRCNNELNNLNNLKIIFLPKLINGEFNL